MFDVENIGAKCFFSDCEFIEEFKIMGRDGHSYDAFKCPLSIDERLCECPLYCKDLESLSIPNYNLMYRELLLKHNKSLKEIDELDTKIKDLSHQVANLYSRIKSKNDKIKDYERITAKHERFFDRVDNECRSLINLHHDRDEYRNYIIDLRNMIKYRSDW